MFVPCRDHCWIRYEKQYTEECDTTCDYAKTYKEKKELEKILVTILNYYNWKECMYCKNRDTCISINECNNFEKYDLDLEKIKRDYKVE